MSVLWTPLLPLSRGPLTTRLSFGPLLYPLSLLTPCLSYTLFRPLFFFPWTPSFAVFLFWAPLGPLRRPPSAECWRRTGLVCHRGGPNTREWMAESQQRRLCPNPVMVAVNVLAALNVFHLSIYSFLCGEDGWYIFHLWFFFFLFFLNGYTSFFFLSWFICCSFVLRLFPRKDKPPQ